MAKTEIYVAAAGGDILRAASRGFHTADMIYRVSGARLYRARGARGFHMAGRVMALDTTGFTGGAPLLAVAEEVAAECERRGYAGIVFDSGGSADARHAALAREISGVEPRLALFLPETLAGACKNAIILVQTAISCGSLKTHLKNAIAKHGRVALEIASIRVEFALPSRRGDGEPITEKQLDTLLAERHGRAFFSDELCVNYFTRGNRFVLFDDGESINRKLNLARSLGIEHAFLYYPQVSGMLGAIDPRGG
jgi:hypothetical protein